MAITVEHIAPDWFDANSIRLPNYKVGRVNFQKGRSYIKINEDGSLAQPFRLYTSLTTAIDASMPTPIQLMDWKFQHGKKESERLTRVAANYGTLLHMEIGKFLIEKVYDLDSTDNAIDSYVSEHNFWEPECGYEWPNKLKEDMLAFMQFFFDYEVIPQGLEYVLLSEQGFGTMIDLVCLLTVDEKGEWGEVYKSGPRKGQPKETTKRVQKRAIINFKSGRKGFYDNHGIQIECERQLWEENFPDMPIDMACNWAPTDWKTTPGYKLKDWTGTVSKEEVTAILQLAEIRYRDRAEKRKYMTMSGVVATSEALVSAIQYEDVEEFCNRKFGNTPVSEKAIKSASKPEAKSEPKQVNFISNPLPI